MNDLKVKKQNLSTFRKKIYMNIFMNSGYIELPKYKL